MKPALPESVSRALSCPELALLWQRIRKQLERTGGEPRGTVTVPVTDLQTASELGAVLGRRLARRVGSSTRVDLSELDKLLREGNAQCGLVETVVALTGEPLLQRQARRDARTIASQQAKSELLGLMDGLPEMSAERILLASTTAGPIPRVPLGTTARTKSWAVYDAAVRAACIWWVAHRQGRRMAAKELAGIAFRGTKKWTDQRRLAFANLVRLPFDQAVDEADISIRLSGPLTWTLNDTIADAAAAYPWIALPAEGIRKLGYITCSAKGILVVENTEAFEKVCLQDGITDRWLCVWNQGNPSKRLMKFLSDLNLPVAAWCDLDAYSIRMVENLEKGIGRPVAPVGMSAQLWRAGTKLDQTAIQLAKARSLASQLATEGPQRLRELAAAIAQTGDCCEQETLYKDVLPVLQTTLREVERAQTSAAGPGCT